MPAAFDARQHAHKFNQPLSFDTSKVTTMHGMFYVRSARALALPALRRALPVHADCVAAIQRPHTSRAVRLLASYARLSTRQKAYALSNANKRLIRCAWEGTSAFLCTMRSRTGAQETALEIRSARVLLERL